MYEKKMDLLKEIKLFVLDMDGTFYLGDKRIDGALEFVRFVQEQGRKILFFTNNSSESSEAYMKKLAHMGCPISREQIMTSGDVTIAYLKKYHNKKMVYLVGTPALEESFRQAGILLWDEQLFNCSRPDVVVAGFDTTLNYQKLERACTYIREGAVFLATHSDINCPTEYGFIPDCGALCAAITLSAGVTPKYLGKPYQETVDMVLGHTGMKPEEVAFVGDRLYTDVAAGVIHGAHGFLVLTGETKLEDIEASEVKPDAVYESLGEMKELLADSLLRECVLQKPD